MLGDLLTLACVAIWAANCPLAARAQTESTCEKQGMRDLKGGETYRNVDYGYALVTPRGVAVCETRSPNPNHGFVVLVGPGATVWVDASYNSLGYRTGDEALRDYIRTVRSEHEIVRETVAAASLGSLPACKGQVRYRGRDGVEMVQEWRMAVKRDAVRSEDEGVLFVIGAKTPAANYAEVERIISDLSQSLKTSD